jgi:putative transposase
VHEGDIQDRDGARLVLEPLIGKLPRLRKLWGDGGYAGQLVDWVRERTGWELEIVKRSDDMRGFVLLPKRWVVEMTQPHYPRDAFRPRVCVASAVPPLGASW